MIVKRQNLIFVMTKNDQYLLALLDVEDRKSWPNRSSRRCLFRPGWKVLLHKTCWSNGKVEWLCILQSIQSTNWNLGQRQSVLKNDDQRLLVLLVSVTAMYVVVDSWNGRHQNRGSQRSTKHDYWSWLDKTQLIHKFKTIVRLDWWNWQWLGNKLSIYWVCWVPV